MDGRYLSNIPHQGDIDSIHNDVGAILSSRGMQ